MAATWGIWVYDKDGFLILGADGFGLRIVLAANVVTESAHVAQSKRNTNAPDGTTIETGWKAATRDTVTVFGRPINVIGHFDWDPVSNDDKNEARLYYKLSSDSTWIQVGNTHHLPPQASGLDQTYKATIGAVLLNLYPDNWDLAIAYSTAYSASGLIRSGFLKIVELKDHNGLLVASTASTAGTSNTLTDTTQTWVVNEFARSFLLLRPGGPNEEEHEILSNTTGGVVTIVGTFTVNPANTDPYEIHSAEVL